jgi:glycosyltransferase involved in cell wall biosynthesis
MYKFSIIMPSTLTPYKNCASNLETKIKRAIDSVLSQSFEDWELIVIADGCQKTMDIVTPYVYDNLPKVRLLYIDKQPKWSGAVRNAGIFKSDGEIITYLDVDDILGYDHLKIINDGFADNDWVYYNDLVSSKGNFIERPNELVLGQCGTSCVSHKRDLGVYWESNTYLHDFVLIKSLIEASHNYSKIATPQYKVCHIPNQFDV